MKTLLSLFFALTLPFEASFASTFIDGVNRAEDLIRVGDTPWVIASNLGDNSWKSGGYYALNINSLTKVEISPDFSQPADPDYASCPKSPNPALLSSHGISLKRLDAQTYRLFSVNNGDRQSIEVYDLSTTDTELKLVWRGCAVLPQGYEGNAVAAYRNGFVVTIPKKPHALLSGVVLQWLPTTSGSSWTEVLNTKYGYDNGILVSPDENWLYINEYTKKKVHKLSLDSANPSDTAVSLKFLPDNLRFAPDGSILVAGQITFALDAAFCERNMKLSHCQLSSAVAQIDPVLFNEAKPILTCRGNAHFNSGTSAIFIGDKLWLGSYKAQSVRIFDSNELTGNEVCLDK